MNGDFALLLTAEGYRKPVEIGGQKLEVRLLSAYESLLCHTEAEMLYDEEIKQSQNGAQALCENAALASRALYLKDKRVFPDAQAALHGLTAQALYAVAKIYGELRKSFLDVDALDNKEIEALKKA